MSRSALARQRAERRRCPKCGRKSAISVVVNVGTATSVCRWCDYESTTLIGGLERDEKETGR